MTEPHQRIQSGKLRKSGRISDANVDSKEPKVENAVYVGIESATAIDLQDYDDEVLVYRQTPTDLCNYQVEILKKIAKGYGLIEDNAIDRTWRRTWNIGSWSINRSMCLSINILQPNIAGCWANISHTSVDTVSSIADSFSSYNLPRSTCTVTGSDNKVQIKGRWTPYVVDKLLRDDIIVADQIFISNLNITQSKIFCWLVVGNNYKYMCRLTKDSLQILSRYIPEWAVDIDEVSAGGSLSLKINSSGSDNDATQLTINSAGSVQYQGTARYLEELPKALRMSLRNTVLSPHLKLFLDSLEYKIVK